MGKSIDYIKPRPVVTVPVPLTLHVISSGIRSKQRPPVLNDIALSFQVVNLTEIAAIFSRISRGATIVAPLKTAYFAFLGVIASSKKIVVVIKLLLDLYRGCHPYQLICLPRPD